MKWQNLKRNKCPQCNKDFLKDLAVTESKSIVKTAGNDCYPFATKLFRHKCGFIISELKYKEITMSMNSKDINIIDELE